MTRAILAPALRSRNFRLFWLAQTISTIGTSLQVIAEGYLIYEITDSTFWLGAVGFIALLPVVPISLVGGVLIDRLARRKLLLVTQIGLMLQAALFGLLALSGRLSLPSVIFLYFIFGALLAIDNPARRAFLVDIVDRDDLANAVALNATIFNISSVIGFALGGVLIAAIGVGGTMMLNAVSYLFPVIALALIRVPDVGLDKEHKSLGVAMTEGIVTLWRQPTILGVIAVTTVVGGLAYPVIGLMPAYAKDIMGVDSIGLGILLSAVALGSVLGTFGAARLGTNRRGRSLIVASFVLPLLVIAFAHSPSMIFACLVLVGVGFVLLILQSLAITLVQLHTPDRVRGRVMTIYSMLHAGSDTGGNLVIGALAVQIGLTLALTAGSIVAILFSQITNLVLPDVRRMQ
ncbi:MAG: MFS transporter [Candidatus Promineifilaceae bacterium]